MKPETVLKHAQTFYGALDSFSTDGVFTGSVTEIFTVVCKLPLSYYTPVRKLLDEFGSLQVIERGTRNQPSIVKLLKPPPDELPPVVGDANVKSSPEPLTTRAALATLQEDVESLKAWRESQRGVILIEALRNIEIRLSNLENPNT